MGHFCCQPECPKNGALLTETKQDIGEKVIYRLGTYEFDAFVVVGEEIE